MPAIRRQARAGIEVAAGSQVGDLPGFAGEGDRYECVAREGVVLPLVPRMDFGNGDQPLTRRIEREIRKAGSQDVGDPPRRPATLQSVDLLVLVVDEKDRFARN